MTLNPGEKQFTGHPISLDFKDGDLQDIFRLFADISGLNIVVNPGVSGKVTLKLNEVPWDQALDLILKANGLGYTLEDNVIRIARWPPCRRRSRSAASWQEERALAGDLWPAHHADLLRQGGRSSADVSRRRRPLGPRPAITRRPAHEHADHQRPPLFLEKAKDLIADPRPRRRRQVEIEARIVVTSRTFTRAPRHPVGLPNQVRLGPVRQHDRPGLPERDDRERPGRARHRRPPRGPGRSGAPTPASATRGRGYAVNLPAAGFNSAIGISLGNILGSFNLDAALTALETSGPWAAPLDAEDHHPEQPGGARSSRASRSRSRPVANNTVTVIFQDAVLTLKVTPQITEAGTVILDRGRAEQLPADFANLVNGDPAHQHPVRQDAASSCGTAPPRSSAASTRATSRPPRTRRRSWATRADPGLPVPQPVRDQHQQRAALFITPRIIRTVVGGCALPRSP